MAYNEQLFRECVNRLEIGDSLFEADHISAYFVKCDDGQIWMVGDCIPDRAVIPDVEEYVYSLQSCIDAAEQWDEEHENEDLWHDVERVREEIAYYQVEEEA